MPSVAIVVKSWRKKARERKDSTLPSYLVLLEKSHENIPQGLQSCYFLEILSIENVNEGPREHVS